MICTLCRSDVPDDALVCPECGDLVTAQVEISPEERSDTVQGLWLVFGVIGFFVMILMLAGVASGASPAEYAGLCMIVLVLAGALLGPALLKSGPAGLLKTAAGQSPRYARRDLAYLRRLRVESHSGGSGSFATYFATFDTIAELSLTPGQYEQLKGCEGQRFVVTHIPELRQLRAFVPAPPTDD